MNTGEIIEQIDVEISKLQQARVLLLGTDSPIKRGAGLPKKEATVSRIIAVKPTEHGLSPEGRARIAAAARARWAKAMHLVGYATCSTPGTGTLFSTHYDLTVGNHTLAQHEKSGMGNLNIVFTGSEYSIFP